MMGGRLKAGGAKVSLPQEISDIGKAILGTPFQKGPTSGVDRWTMELDEKIIQADQHQC